MTFDPANIAHFLAVAVGRLDSSSLRTNAADRAEGVLRTVGMADRFTQITVLAGRAVLPLAIYLAVATIANLIAEHTGNPWLARIVRITTPRFLTTLLVGIVATATPAGAQVDASTSSGAARPVGASLRINDPPVMQVVEDGPRHVGSIPWITVAESAGGSPTGPVYTAQDPLELDAAEEPGNDPKVDQGDPGADPRIGIGEEPAVTPTGHIVEVGEHLWTIAESTLIRSGIEHPDGGTITRYWSQLIEANRDRLVDPTDPDLIMPGQQLVLPPIG